MKQHHAIQVLLVTALVVWNLATLAMLHTSGKEWPEQWGILGLGLALGQMLLAATYFALGRINVVLRIGILLGVLVQSAYLATVSLVERGGQKPANFELFWFSVLLLYAGIEVLPLVAVPLSGGRVMHASEPMVSVSPRWQFSIWSLLSFTTAVAILAAVIRWTALPLDAAGSILAFGGIAALPAWSCVASLLTVRSLPAALIAPSLVVLMTGFFLSYTGFPPRDDYWELWALSLVYGGIAIATTLLLRLAGYRLQWSARHVAAENSKDIVFLSPKPLGMEQEGGRTPQTIETESRD